MENYRYKTYNYFSDIDYEINESKVIYETLVKQRIELIRTIKSLDHIKYPSYDKFVTQAKSLACFASKIHGTSNNFNNKFVSHASYWVRGPYYGNDEKLRSYSNVVCVNCDAGNPVRISNQKDIKDLLAHEIKQIWKELITTGDHFMSLKEFQKLSIKKFIEIIMNEKTLVVHNRLKLFTVPELDIKNLYILFPKDSRYV